MIDIKDKIGVTLDSKPFSIILHEPWCAKMDPGEPHNMFASTIGDVERLADKMELVEIEQLEMDIAAISATDVDARAEKLMARSDVRDKEYEEEEAAVQRICVARADAVQRLESIRSARLEREKEEARYSFITHKCTKKPSGWPGEQEKPMSFEEAALLAMKNEKR